MTLAGWIGLIGWLQFLALLGVFALYGITRWFEPPTLWLFASPPAFGVFAWYVDVWGRSLASRKHFEYHYKPDFALWLEGETRRTYPPNRDIGTEAEKSPSTP